MSPLSACADPAAVGVYKPRRPQASPLFRIVVGDVREEAAVARAVRGAEVVYHLARANGNGAASASEVQPTNVTGTAVVADVSARAGARLVVNCSSIAVYGYRYPDVINEETPLRPETGYGRSKARPRTVEDTRARGVRHCHRSPHISARTALPELTTVRAINRPPPAPGHRSGRELAPSG